LSFSAHTDAKGILDLVKHVAPRNVVLVHGEKLKMVLLKNKIATDLGIPCYDPANLETVEVESRCLVKMGISKQLLKAPVNQSIIQQATTVLPSAAEMAKEMNPVALPDAQQQLQTVHQGQQLPHVRAGVPVEGVLIMEDSSRIKLIHPSEVESVLGVASHGMSFSCMCPMYLACDNLLPLEHLHQNIPSPESVQPLQAGSTAIPVAMETNIPQVSDEEEMEKETSKKRYRMDLQRHLSLDLEREPVLEDSGEEGSEFESPAFRDISGPSSPMVVTNRFENSDRMVNSGRITLDINAIPDPSTPAESMSNGSKGQQDLELLSVRTEEATTALEPMTSSAILHLIYLHLVESFGEGVLEEKEESIQGKSIHIRVSPETSSHNLAVAKGYHLQGTDIDGGGIPALVLACDWHLEDDALANRAIRILQMLKLKLS
jgi:hypothetical protein